MHPITHDSFPHADAFVEAVRLSVGTEAAFMSFLVKDHVFRQQNASLETGQLCDQGPGFCVWTLVPEQAQAMVIEDTLLDARFAAASGACCFQRRKFTCDKF